MIADLEPNAWTQSWTTRERFAASISRQRFETAVLGGFAAIALLLAALGLYAVVAHSVIHRTREIGVRLALGASPFYLFRKTVVRAVLPGAAGLVIGLGVFLAVRQILARYLFQLQPTDFATHAVVLLVFLAVIVIAGAIPAWRAARVDPWSTLRHE